MLGFNVYLIFFKYFNKVYSWCILAIKCLYYMLISNYEGSKLIIIDFIYESIVSEQDLEP